MDVVSTINELRRLASKFVIALVMQDVDNKPHGYIADLARKIGICNSNISIWRRGLRSSLDLETIEKVGSYYGMSMFDIARHVGLPHLADAFWVAGEYPQVVSKMKSMSREEVEKMFVNAKVRSLSS